MAVPHNIGSPAQPDLTGPIRALPWAGDALCATHPNPNLWFPERSASVDPDAPEARAKAICGHCPALDRCRDYAVNQSRTLDGIWGGLTANERRNWRRRNGAA